MPIIDIDNLSYRYPDGTTGLDRIDLSVDKGTLVVVTGPNGSGKTTLLKQLNGLLLPQTGTVKINGKEVAQDLRRPKTCACRWVRFNPVWTRPWRRLG